MSRSLEVLLGDVAAAGADAGDGAADADVALEAHHDGAVHRRHHGDLISIHFVSFYHNFTMLFLFRNTVPLQGRQIQIRIIMQSLLVTVIPLRILSNKLPNMSLLATILMTRKFS